MIPYKIGFYKSLPPPTQYFGKSNVENTFFERSSKLFVAFLIIIHQFFFSLCCFLVVCSGGSLSVGSGQFERFLKYQTRSQRVSHCLMENSLFLSKIKTLWLTPRWFFTSCLKSVCSCSFCYLKARC